MKKYKIFGANFCIFCALLLLLIILLVFQTVFLMENGNKDVSEILANTGIPVDKKCSQTTVTVPYVFSNFYNYYNRIQKQSGFDLTPYKGSKIKKCTYSIVGNKNAFLTLLFYGDKIIGGDYSEYGEDGFIKPLEIS